ncbi:MAG TPA: DMT family transporter [Chthoniobacteraceae bacterium]|nr:DMT family transporter [Chthoniobacteraceae bacterium]
MSNELNTRKPVDGAAAGLMVVLCLIWGLQQTAIKAAAPDVAPVLQVALRSGVAALLVGLFRGWISRDPWIKGVAFGPGLIVGVLFAGEFLFVAEGLRYTTASHMAVFPYTSPMFAALGLHFFLPDERLTRSQWIGIGLAFVGIAITFLGPKGGALNEASPDWLLGDLLGLCAGASWGLTTVAIRVTRLSEAPAAQTLFYQLVAGFVVLMAATVATDQLRFTSSVLAWSSLGFQTIIVSFASFLAWFWLLRSYLAARLGVLSFMTPLFGVAMGAILLDEPLNAYFLGGAACVLGGMLIVNGKSILRKKETAPEASRLEDDPVRLT